MPRGTGVEPELGVGGPGDVVGGLGLGVNRHHPILPPGSVHRLGA